MATTLFNSENTVTPSFISTLKKKIFSLDAHTHPLEKETPVTVTELFDFSLKLIAYLYNPSVAKQPQLSPRLKEFNKQFYNLVQSEVKGAMFKKSQYKGISEHLNILYYSSPSFRYKPFFEIEQEVLLRWR